MGLLLHQPLSCGRSVRPAMRSLSPVRTKLACAKARAHPHPREGGVAAFMSAHSKTPYITPGTEFSSGKGAVRGRRGQQLAFTL